MPPNTTYIHPAPQLMGWQLQEQVVLFSNVKIMHNLDDKRGNVSAGHPPHSGNIQDTTNLDTVNMSLDSIRSTPEQGTYPTCKRCRHLDVENKALKLELDSAKKKDRNSGKNDCGCEREPHEGEHPRSRDRRKR